MTTPVIEAHGLRKSYGPTVAVDGVDLRVEEGRILGIVGPNGAGKTTLLHAILGLTQYEGSLRVLGHDPWNDRDALMTDATGGQPVKMMGMDAPREGVLVVNLTHTMEHYGNLVTYMRLKNVVPPTSEPGGMGR